MKSLLQAVMRELQQLQQAGESRVFVGDSTLDRLRAALVRTGSRPGGDTPAVGGPGSFKEALPFGRPPPTEDPVPAAGMRPRKAAPVGETPSAEPAPEPIPPPPEFSLPEGDKRAQWNWLRDRVLNCPVCRAHVRTGLGKHVVFGVGSLEAEVFFCGEAPGAEEEDAGEPFVGRAGQLLTRIIQAMGRRREDVYIGNIMNWRPEMPNMAIGNRAPSSEEMRFCLPYLRAQFEIVRPKVIVALGNTAVSGLLGPDPSRRISAIRGRWHDFHGTPLMPTYHPSYLLRNSTLQTKRIVWEDMLQVMDRVGWPVSPKQRGFFRESGGP